MKPAKFDYYAPGSLPEALALTAQFGDEAKILAGGQSLMPLMNMRLARPGVVIDINRISEMAYISQDGNDALAIGALTRQRAMERSSAVRETFPLLAAAVPYIGHSQIRNRGTIGGSMAHADPAAELPALGLALDAELTLASATGQRVVKAEDFFLGQLTTALAPGEILTEVRFPGAIGRWAWGFQEVCRREGDFALVGAIALLDLDGSGACQAARITMFGVGGAPARIPTAEERLVGTTVDSADREAAAEAVSQALDPVSDIHASATYRKQVGGVMARRALEDAIHQANGASRP